MEDKDCKSNENLTIRSCCCTLESEAARTSACGLPSPPTGLPQGSNSHWVSGYLETEVGKVPVVETTLGFKDHLGSLKARLGIGRMSYKVEPGLYATGSPDSDSPVFVSANYKMSFDILRSQIKNLSSWILVLDTKGINVWCAAGKGTFGTEEILNRMLKANLSKTVSHKTLIVPQLGAPGVSAHKVKNCSGYRIVYGPVRAADIPEFMENNLQATSEMRRVKFGFRDRIVLTPIEVRMWGWWPLIIIVGLFFLAGLHKSGFSIVKVWKLGPQSVLMYLAAYFCGAVLTPALLPWLPGRAFSLKGAFSGLLLALVVGWYRWDASLTLSVKLNILSWLLITPSVSSFLALNFTGASTYTSLSGVRKETRLAVPIQTGAVVIGLFLLIAGYLFI